MSVEEINGGAQQLRRLIRSGEPFFVGRNGTIELQTLQFFLSRRSSGESYPSFIRQYIENNAGVFPSTDESLDAWCKEYYESLEHLSMVAAGWYAPTKLFEDRLLTAVAPNAARCPLRTLEPYYVEPDLQWTRLLERKQVCVVSSFTQTIQNQLKVSGVWKGDLKHMIPYSVKWSFVQTGYAPSLAQDSYGWPTGIDSWKEAVDSVVSQVMATGSSIALIGCGGLGMLIGAELRRRGCSAIVMGGAIQVLFGIKGRRWQTHDVISKLWNDAWVWPSEVPGGAQTVEGGCYW